MKKLLVLGGTHFQIPLINAAKARGIYTITCDYLPNNPAHQYSDEYWNISTTDKETVLKYAKLSEISGIIAFASDPSAPTAAYVAKELCLPGSNLAATETLCNKSSFRLTLQRLGLPTPRFFVCSTFDELVSNMHLLGNRAVVKPIDSSGSKGVGIFTGEENLLNLFQSAMKFSTIGKIIVEEYINGPQIHGDGFYFNNTLQFAFLGDHYFNGKTNSSTLYPSQLHTDILDEVLKQVEVVLQALDYRKGAVNIEARYDKRRNTVYLIEIGPRNGGHLTPDTITVARGFNFTQACLDLALENNFVAQKLTNKKYFVNLVLYSKHPGIYKSLSMTNDMKKHLKQLCIYKKSGEVINLCLNSGTAVGTAILKFSSYNEMSNFVNLQHTKYKVCIS